MFLFRGRGKRLEKLNTRRYVSHYQKDEPIGIYIHVPFCVRKCPYCDFYSVATGDFDPGALYDDYTNAVITGLSETAGINSTLRVDTVYFGGGTPTLLGGERLSSILRYVKKSFDVDPKAEITLEANPGTLKESDALLLVKNGFNRISIGVQSFSNHELSRLGRIHSAETAAEAIKLAKRSGFSNISIDLMYGTPGQSMNTWGKTLTLAVTAGVQHISLYSLTIEEGTPYGIVTPPHIPDDDQVADMYLNAVKYLEANGFRQYEISNFSLPGRECRHNLKYWHCQEYLGYGPGAHSYYKDARYSYIRDLAAYIDAMKTGSEGLIDGDPEIIRPRERVGEYLMLGLRLREGISEGDFRRNYARDFAPVRKALLPYLKTGHVREENGRFSLTPEGFLISNRIISDVLDAAREEGARP